MLKIGSILISILIICYSIYHIYQNKGKLSDSARKIVSLLTCVSSLAMGFFIIQISNFNIWLSAIICLFVSIVSGILVGESDLKIKGLNQILSGFIGGTIGLVLGYMVFISDIAFLIVAILFIIFVYMILRWIDKLLVTEPQNKGKKGTKGKKIKKPSYGPTVGLGGGLILLLIIIAVNVNHISIGMFGQPQSQNAVIDEVNDMQVATIHVTPSGPDPKNTIFKSQTMLKVVFNVDQSDNEKRTLISNDLHLNVPLKKGPNVILLDDPQKGEYHFSLLPGNTSGLFTVK
ncbi:hypothetical protein J5Y03_00575 [Bacillus sp. RG28]|uniref:EfeO-type cupredoxin-like domain-containing protein n=1 Tax=Gottfriedia endophytica TaxID=2820819 RepID=A0A940SHN2_9BACI|nr:hypothetical protein [Gottfriedia endophytica]MBP0723676.1 hypothetical protein [Gottfriedia endophytica]